MPRSVLQVHTRVLAVDTKTSVRCFVGLLLWEFRLSQASAGECRHVFRELWTEFCLCIDTLTGSWNGSRLVPSWYQAKWELKKSDFCKSEARCDPPCQLKSSVIRHQNFIITFHLCTQFLEKNYPSCTFISFLGFTREGHTPQLACAWTRSHLQQAFCIAFGKVYRVCHRVTVMIVRTFLRDLSAFNRKQSILLSRRKSFIHTFPKLEYRTLCVSKSLNFFCGVRTFGARTSTRRMTCK